MNPIGALQRYAIGALALIIVGGLAFGYLHHRFHAAGVADGIASCSRRIATMNEKGADACALAIAALNGKFAKAEAKAQADARAREQAHAAEMMAITTRQAQELQDAKANGDRVAADLRAGNLRLRQQWRGCEAAGGVPAAGAGVARADGADERRAESAGDLVRIAAEQDARIRALQAVIKADRQE